MKKALWKIIGLIGNFFSRIANRESERVIEMYGQIFEVKSCKGGKARKKIVARDRLGNCNVYPSRKNLYVSKNTLYGAGANIKCIPEFAPHPRVLQQYGKSGCGVNAQTLEIQ